MRNGVMRRPGTKERPMKTKTKKTGILMLGLMLGLGALMPAAAIERRWQEAHEQEELRGARRKIEALTTDLATAIAEQRRLKEESLRARAMAQWLLQSVDNSPEPMGATRRAGGQKLRHHEGRRLDSRATAGAPARRQRRGHAPQAGGEPPVASAARDGGVPG